jgi:hypothetical protein
VLEDSGRLFKNGNGWQSPQPVDEPIEQDEQEQTEESENPDAEYEDFQRRSNKLLGG